MLSNLFYTINFSIALIVAVISLTAGFLIIIIFIINRQCRTIVNLMSCNTAAGIIFYFIMNSISSIYGLRDDWAQHQPACVFRAYCQTVASTALCYSQLIQAISRLYFVILYKYRCLLTWRVHWLMIIINWLISIILPILPFFFDGAYILEEESRICTITTKVFVTSTYCVIVVYLIPFSIVVVIYSSILYRIQQSTRRVRPLTTNVIKAVKTNNISIPNMKHDKKVMKIMLILIGALTCSGTLYMTLIIWHILRIQSSPPESFYLLSLNSISICITIWAIFLFGITKDMKKCIFTYLRILCDPLPPIY